MISMGCCANVLSPASICCVVGLWRGNLLTVVKTIPASAIQVHMYATYMYRYRYI